MHYAVTNINHIADSTFAYLYGLSSQCSTGQIIKIIITLHACIKNNVNTTALSRPLGHFLTNYSIFQTMLKPLLRVVGQITDVPQSLLDFERLPIALVLCLRMNFCVFPVEVLGKSSKITVFGAM